MTAQGEEQRVDENAEDGALRELKARVQAEERAKQADTALLFDQLKTSLQHERGWRAWLRSRSSRARFGLMVGLVAALSTGVLLWVPRGAWGSYPVAWLVVCFSVGIAATGWGALRWPHRPAWEGWKGWVLGLAVGIGMPLLLVGLAAAGLAGHQGAGTESALKCLVEAVLVVSPVLVVLGLLMRGISGFRGVLMAACAALTGNLLGVLHCPVGDVPHIVVGHAVFPLLLVILSVGWSVWARGRSAS